MHLFSFAMGVFALLVLPGPTNALLALSGEGLSLARCIRRVGIVLSAYLMVILPVSTLAAPLLTHHPLALQIAKLAAAGWVLYLAVRLWRSDGTDAAIDGRSLMVTTLLNPKAVIIGLTMMPQQSGASNVAMLCVLALVVATTSCLWLGIGRLALSTRRQRMASRWGSAVLATFSLVLTVSAF